MTMLKTMTLAAALIVGTTSLAMAQAQGSSGPDGQLKAAGAADNPPAPGTRKPGRHHGTTQHRMYMSTRGKKGTGTNGGY
jgi:hypothetical protein